MKRVDMRRQIFESTWVLMVLFCFSHTGNPVILRVRQVRCEVNTGEAGLVFAFSRFYAWRQPFSAKWARK